MREVIEKGRSCPSDDHSALRPGGLDPSVVQRAAPHVAVVLTGDVVAFVAAAQTPARLAARLAEWIGERVEYTLWPRDAEQVRQLLDQRCYDDAVVRYFASVGQRWDRERLTIHALG